MEQKRLTVLIGPGSSAGSNQSKDQSLKASSGRCHLLGSQISTCPLTLPPPPPPLHLLHLHLHQLDGGHLGARQEEGGHRAGAGLKLVRRVVLEATEAAADRTSIRPLLLPLLLLLLHLLLLLQLLPTYVCHKAVRGKALHCVLEPKGNSGERTVL